MRRVSLGAFVVLLVLAGGCISVDLETPAVAPDGEPARPSSSHSASPPSTARPVPASAPPRPVVTPPSPVAAELPAEPPFEGRPYVVVATFDSGINPFHPTWRSNDTWRPRSYPSDAIALSLQLTDDFAADVASSPALALLTQHDDALFTFPGTRILGAKASPTNAVPVFDPAGVENDHGARAASQISGTGYAIADHAFIVALDYDGESGDSWESYIERQMEWINEQPWIDIIHANLAFPAPYPLNNGMMDQFVRATQLGKLVVLPAGNGLGNTGLTPPYPQETQHTTAAPGTLVAGAVDQCVAGYFWSNLDPHVVMDGMGTAAASSVDYGTQSFSGTSSASPRTAGYAAELLYQLRVAVGDVQGVREGALVVLDDAAAWPAAGPLADGRLTVAEFHEAIRKTAQPLHDSPLDGEPWISPCPSTPSLGGATPATYAKHGYGELSEQTLPLALDVLLGRAPMPERPVEDMFFSASEAYRETHHGLPV